MRFFVPPPLIGIFTFLIYTLNTFFWAVPLLAVALLKWIIPLTGWRRFSSRLINGCASRWIDVNNLNLQVTRKIRWDVEGVAELDPNGWYLVLANHQSWVDILVLQKVFQRRIPLLKFFLKKELVWVPVLGLAWWALDFPFMKRYSRAYIDKHPEKNGKDVEITRRACRKFRTIPVSIMNFVEGTRFTPEKHRLQQSPYSHLLKPKAAGTALVLSAMGEEIHRILNVTIAYPEGRRSFWEFLCGGTTEIKVRIEPLEIGQELLGDYFHDPEFRDRFQNWLNGLWREKDLLLDELLGFRRPVGCLDTIADHREIGG